MKLPTKSIVVLVSALALMGCSDDNPWAGSTDKGGIKLNFSSDSRVMRQTRADDNVSPIVPDANDFAVKLVKSDGSYSKTWSSIDAFNGEKSFGIGDYTLTAYYGDINSEGFELPHFKGEAEVHVSPGAVTESNVTATLANAMVSVRYTDDFKNNFPAYSAAVQSEGHDWVVFSQSEDRPAYIAPSKVNLNLTLTNTSGEKVTIQPANFEAVARHHYVVTIGVSGNITLGDFALDIQFDDDVVSETVAVSLGDELFSAPAPTLTAKDFFVDTAIDKFEYIDMSDTPEMDVFAYGGLKSATLTVETDNGYTPSFGNSVQLVKADAVTQSQLAAEGIDCGGFFRNPDKMGIVNLKKFLETVPAGKYEVSLQVVDAMTRTSEPLKLTAQVKSVEFEVTPVAEADFMTDEISVDVSTNCPYLQDYVTFKVPDVNNRMVEATINNVTEINSDNPPYKYRYVLAVDPQVTASIDVKATFAKSTKDTKVTVKEPQYTIAADAYAKYVVLKVTASEASITQTIMDNLVFYDGNTQIPTSRITTYGSGLIAISGLTPGSSYSTYKAKLVGTSFEKAVPSFTAEAATDVANGDFSSLGSEIVINPETTPSSSGSHKFNGVCVGGTWGAVAFKYQTYTTIGYQEPSGWATVNANTCYYPGSSNVNTWYIVPSTFASDGAVMLRSVGFSHNGAALENTKSSFTYYCTDTPTDAELSKAPGELFLGSYSFNGSENRTDGVNFASRPSSLSFDYSYSAYNNEVGEVYIRFYDSANNLIIEKIQDLNASSSMKSCVIKLDSYSWQVKTAKIQLGFKSTKSGTTPSVKIPTGSSLKEDGVSLNTKYTYGLSKNNYHALATGSVLTIDNVKLEYADKPVSTPAAKPARNKRK